MARPKAVDYDDKRRLILDSAARLFAAHGFGGTSMAMIAEAAGGTKAWLYHYWDGKEAIADDLLTGFLTELTVVSSTAVAGAGSPEDRLRHLIRDTVRVCAAGPDRSGLFEMVAELPPSVSRRLLRLQKRFVADLDTALVAVAPELDQSGSRRTAAVQSVLGILNWQHRWWRRTGSLGADEWADVVVDLLLGGVRAVAIGGQASR